MSSEEKIVLDSSKISAPVCLRCWQDAREEVPATHFAYIEQRYGYGSISRVIDWGQVCVSCANKYGHGNRIYALNLVTAP